MGRLLRMALVAGLLLLLLPAGEVAAAEAAPFTREYRQGELQLTLEMSATRLRLADRLSCRLRLLAPEGWQVRFQAPGADLAGLRLIEQYDDPQRLQAGGPVERARVMSFEPLTTGELSLPGLTVQAGPAGSAPLAITTEPVTLSVVSLLAAAGTKSDIDDIQPMLVPPPPPWRLVGFAAAGLLLGGLAYWLWRRHQAPPPSPDQLALAQLEALQAKQPAREAELQAFHVELSGILRHYIEAGFGLQAPGRTSEEFLREAAGGLLGPSQCQRLEGFLAHCDRVKFARYRPDNEETARAVALCRSFITASRVPEGSR